MINTSKIQEWIKLYLDHIREITPETHVTEEEGYKFRAVDIFQKNYNPDALDFVEMLDRAIEHNNLATGSWYFPRKMLLIFAKENPERTKAALETLFDEAKPVGERIDEVEDVFDDLMAERNVREGEESHHFIGVRFLSLLLGYRYPNLHDALKPREWKMFCNFVDPDFSIPNGTTSGTQYVTFQPYIEALRLAIHEIAEIDALREQLTRGLDFKDSDFHWMAQDVIYVTARLIANGRVENVGADEVESGAAQDAPDEAEDEHVPATTEDRFTYEEDLEHFCIENFANLPIDGRLKVYSDATGKTGRQYPTSVGDIDILATDAMGDFVVIELKRDLVNEKVLGQLAKYLQWVEENLANPNKKKVSGIVIARRSNASLVDAVRALRFPVTVLNYDLRLHLTKAGD